MIETGALIDSGMVAATAAENAMPQGDDARDQAEFAALLGMIDGRQIDAAPRQLLAAAANAGRFAAPVGIPAVAAAAGATQSYFLAHGHGPRPAGVVTLRQGAASAPAAELSKTFADGRPIDERPVAPRVAVGVAERLPEMFSAHDSGSQDGRHAASDLQLLRSDGALLAATAPQPAALREPGIVATYIVPAKLEVAVPLAHPRFAEGLAQQLTILASADIQHAQIRLNPPELGPLEVRITIHRDEAVVQLASQHAAVRDSVEESLPRLREMLDQAGLKLTDSGVFAELPDHQHALARDWHEGGPFSGHQDPGGDQAPTTDSVFP